MRSKYVDAIDASSFGAALTIFYDTMLRYLWGSLGALATLGVVVAFFAWLGGPSTPGDLAARAGVPGDHRARGDRRSLGAMVVARRLVARGRRSCAA